MPSDCAQACGSLGRLPRSSFLHRWRRDGDNPYAGLLALSNSFVVTGDSASMLAEACASGRPVHYVALPWPAKRKRISTFVLRRLARRRVRLGERGTPKQQDRFGRWLDALLAAGVLRLPRDMGALHEGLRWGGLAQPLGEAAPRQPIPSDDLERTVASVRRVLLTGRAVER